MRCLFEPGFILACSVFGALIVLALAAASPFILYCSLFVFAIPP